MKKTIIFSLIAFVIANQASAQENATETIDVVVDNVSATNSDVIATSTATTSSIIEGEVALDENENPTSSTTDSVIEQEVPTSTERVIINKSEIATKIVIKVEQVIPVFEAYLKRVALINEKISAKSSDENSDFSKMVSESELLRKNAQEKLVESKKLIADINEENLSETLVLIRSNLNDIKEMIFSSKEKSKEAISYLKEELIK